jgi:DNA-binding protein HU-beta
MNKSDLVNAIASNADLTKAQAKTVLESITGTIKDELSKKGEVQLVGFGKFSTVDRKERKGRNPQTGEALMIPAKTVVKFKPGKNLADTVNN